MARVSILACALSVLVIALAGCRSEGAIKGAYLLTSLGDREPKPGIALVGIELEMPGKFAPFHNADFKLECAGGRQIDAAGLCDGPLKECANLGFGVMELDPNMKPAAKQSPSPVFALSSDQAGTCTTLHFRNVWSKPFALKS